MIQVAIRTHAFERKIQGEDAQNEQLACAIFIVGKGQLRTYEIVHIGGKGAKRIYTSTSTTDDKSLAYGSELLRSLEKKWLLEGYQQADPASRQGPTLNDLMGSEFTTADFYNIHNPTVGKTQLMRKITLRKP